jgi:predicted lipoprotein with Yx(FWY)xxD motif
MHHARLTAALAAISLLVAPVAALAAGMVVDAKGITLYIFDKDTDGKSTCYDTCAAKWPPYLGSADATLTEGWTLVDRTDGTKQWAYDGKPMYYFAGDKAPGDKAGDGLGGVWHVIVE